MNGLRIQEILNPLESLCFPKVCQICNYNPAFIENGFVCRICQKNTHSIKPPWCFKCGTPKDTSFCSETTCDNCRNGEHSFAKARSLFKSQDFPREVIHRLKYNQSEFYAPLINKWMSKAVKLDLNIRPTAIIPVPLHTTKERERGFNQAEIIAKIASRHFKVPIINDLLIRIKATYSQTHLSRSKRMSNVEGAFICARKQIMGSYLLIDDVITTGSTANACAKVLSAHGATLVEVMTITRGTPQFI